MKTLNFTIKSTSNEYQFPDHEDPCGAYKVYHLNTLEETDEDDDYYFLQEYRVEVYPGHPESRGDALGNYFREALLPAFVKAVSTPCGDDEFYDYRPDYAEMISQYRGFGIMDKDIFEEFLNKLNSALHTFGAGWATDED